MKIDVTEAQARRYREHIRGNGELKDLDLKLASALDNATRNPMLTASELATVTGLVESFVEHYLPTKGDDGRVLDLAKAALPKLQAMAKKQAQLDEVKARTFGADMDQAG